MLKFLIPAFALFAFAVPARGASSGTIREFPIATLERLGEAIYRQDSAAWVATDALRAAIPDLRGVGLVGWIVEDSDAGQRVRFLRDVGKGLEAGYDIGVDANLRTTVTEATDRTLTEAERAMWAARTSALAGLSKVTVCRPGYNVVVLKDPERDGWLVWMLSPMPKLGVIPIGIHYRFSISPDGRKVLQRDALSKACGDLDPDEPTRDPATAVAMTHIVSKTPLETHVFLQRQFGKPFYVMTAAVIWKVEAGRIILLDDSTPR